MEVSSEKSKKSEPAGMNEMTKIFNLSFQEYYQSQIDWLLEGDASIRYQAHRDLLNSDSVTISNERNLILNSGWGKRLLDRQDEAGTWARGFYSPKWTSTFYTLMTLKRLGAQANKQINKALMLLLNKGFYADGGMNFWKNMEHSETCVTGMMLSLLCHFQIRDKRIKSLAEHLYGQQMEDMGWNCQSYRGDNHSSFHTTLSVLEGLREYEKISDDPLARQKQDEGVEFLLQHRLFKSHRTGKIVKSTMLLFSFPPRWYYDVMKVLDYLQERNSPKDPRMQDSIDLLLSKRTSEGFWKLQNKHSGKTYFDMEKPGEISRINTLRALRILKWWG